jgi:hypothetical protein
MLEFIAMFIAWLIIISAVAGVILVPWVVWVSYGVVWGAAAVIVVISLIAALVSYASEHW